MQPEKDDADRRIAFHDVEAFSVRYASICAALLPTGRSIYDARHVKMNDQGGLVVLFEDGTFNLQLNMVADGLLVDVFRHVSGLETEHHRFELPDGTLAVDPLTIRDRFRRRRAGIFTMGDRDTLDAVDLAIPVLEEEIRNLQNRVGALEAFVKHLIQHGRSPREEKA